MQFTEHIGFISMEELKLNRDDRQKEGIDKWIKSGCRATWVWATGFGKSFGAIKAIKIFLSKNQGKVIIIIVPTEVLKVQWMQILVKFNLFYDVSIEIINSAIKKTSPIDFIILDECHKYASAEYFSIFEKRNPKLILGLSAVYTRLDGRESLLEKYCPVCDTITIQEAIFNKWLSPYKEYKVLIDPPDIEDYKEYNKAFINAFSFFNFDFDIAMKSMTNIVYRRNYGKTMGIPSAEVDAITFTWGRMLKARKYFVMDHPKKIEITQRILDYRPDSKAITFSATIKQAEKIGRGYIVHSGKTKKKNGLTMAQFSQLKTGVINSVKGLNEGVDIPGLNLGILLCNNSSTQEKSQRVGRIIRYEEDKEAEVFTLVMKGTMEEGWYNTSTAGKNYIEITEAELNDILQGVITMNVEQTAVKSDILFRL